MQNIVLDISSWQDNATPTIDWQKAKDAGVIGVMVKFTQGVSYVNPKALTNAQTAHEYGLLVGAYHVGDPGVNTAEAEAAFFLQHCEKAPIDFAVALDLENFGKLQYTEAKDWADRWLAVVHGRAQVELIYLNHWLWSKFGSMPWGVELWAAQFDSSPDVVPFMVQKGSMDVPGFNGQVDYNVLTSTRAVNLGDSAVVATGPKMQALPVLHLGDNGPAVFALQTLLRLEAYNLAVDGQLGQTTMDSVTHVQDSNLIAEHGQVGPLTWAALAPAQARLTRTAPLSSAGADGQPAAPTLAGDAAALAQTGATIEGMNAAWDNSQGGATP